MHDLVIVPPGARWTPPILGAARSPVGWRPEPRSRIVWSAVPAG